MPWNGSENQISNHMENVKQDVITKISLNSKKFHIFSMKGDMG